MSALAYLIPVALFLGLLGLAAFLWALKSGQFEDLDGAAHRILFDDDETQPRPLSDPDKHASLRDRPEGTSGSNQ
jgi:cbb3-type cytochrome oxidase maturation protein